MFIGRKEQQEELRQICESKQSEFVVIFGRRRVGKTFLIREFFKNSFAFYHTGLLYSDKKAQLAAFNFSLNKYGKKPCKKAKNWFDSFVQLRELLENTETDGKKIVFIDEMPSMDTQKSDFLQGLDFFWNAYAAAEKNIVLLVCGSASSWIVKKLLKNRGGLHNRVTQQIVLQPFTLAETEEYFSAKSIVLSRYQMAESYMIFGGVPYYLSLFQKKYGLSQNIDNLCFSKNGKLRDEFEQLYASLFNNYENHVATVKALSTKTKGLTRSEIVNLTKLPNGGNFTKTLQELELCGFIRKYNAFEKKQKEAIYQLVDNFTLFYYNFMADNRSGDEHFWTNLLENAAHRAWSGYAFEQVCLEHITQIKHKLGILGVHTKISSWLCKTEEGGAQIDLLIDRNDNVINLCEIKYSKAEFVIDKKYNAELRNKKELFRRESKTCKALHQTLITTFGVKRNEFWGEVQSEIILDDLFN